MDEHKICVNGSRDFNDPELLARHLDDRIPVGAEKSFRIIAGGARGADRLAENYARKRGIPLSVYPANWNADGKAAGFIRNKQMVDLADELISFWNGTSRGTKHTIDLANAKGIPVNVIHYLDCGIPPELCDSVKECEEIHEAHRKLMTKWKN